MKRGLVVSVFAALISVVPTALGSYSWGQDFSAVARKADSDRSCRSFKILTHTLTGPKSRG